MVLRSNLTNMKAAISLILACAIIGVPGIVQAAYDCDTTVCTFETGCRCPSPSPPGGLTVGDLPQFVVMTNDDAVNKEVVTQWGPLVEGKRQSNGCPVPVTWFTTTDGTDCDLVKELYARGDEIADHTLSHPEIDSGFSTAKAIKEVLGARGYLNEACEIPLSKIVGYRDTYLTTVPTVREILYENDFLYQSSLIFNEDDIANRVWPFTMDNGVPVSCDSKYTVCNDKETYPGLWHIPIWPLKYDGQTFTMDPGGSSAGNGNARPAFDVMKFNFDAAYNGNRAPVPFYTHVFWFDKKRQADGEKFVDYALSKPYTFFVTGSQLIEWMENPVPKEQTAAWLAGICNDGNKTLAAAYAPGPGPVLAPIAAPVPAPMMAPVPAPMPVVAPVPAPVEPPIESTLDSLVEALAPAGNTVLSSSSVSLMMSTAVVAAFVLGCLLFI